MGGIQQSTWYNAWHLVGGLVRKVPFPPSAYLLLYVPVGKRWGGVSCLVNAYPH